MMTYTVQAKVTEGILILSELRRRIEIDFNRTGTLSVVIPARPPESGQRFGGPYYTYEALFGVPHEMWDKIEYQLKGPNRVLALRAYRKPEWENSDIGLHLQIKLLPGDRLAFRCTVNGQTTRIKYVPSSCQDGSVNDWGPW